MANQDRVGVRPMTRRHFLEMAGAAIGLAVVVGPKTVEASPAYAKFTSDSATFDGFPAKVDGMVVSPNTEFRADGIGAFVDKAGAGLPSLSRINRAEIPVDSTGALVLPENRMFVLDTHDGNVQPDGKDRTTPIYIRMAPGEALYISGGEFSLIRAHAATVGNLDMVFPQIDVRTEKPGVKDPQDHGIFILSANDAATPEGGPVISIEGAVPGHALAVKFKAGTVNPRIAEAQVYGFWQISGGNGFKDLTAVNLENGAVGQWRADVGPSLGSNVRRPLDKGTMFQPAALVKNF